MPDKDLHTAQMWHEILMMSSTSEDVEKYSELMNVSPVEIRILLMADSSPDLLLREYTSALNIPKSTLTSILNRLEKRHYLKRTISEKDRRSFGLVLDTNGTAFLQKYLQYQAEIGGRILGGLNGEEQQELISLLEKISSYMVRKQRG